MPDVNRFRPLSRVVLFVALALAGSSLGLAEVASRPDSDEARAEAGTTYERFLVAIEAGDVKGLRTLCSAPKGECTELLDAELDLIAAYAGLRGAFDRAYEPRALESIGFAGITEPFEPAADADLVVQDDQASFSDSRLRMGLRRQSSAWTVRFELTPGQLTRLLTPRGHNPVAADKVIANLHAEIKVFDQVASDVRAGKYLSAADAYGVLNAGLRGLGRLGPQAVIACVDLTAPLPWPSVDIPVVELRGDPADLGAAHARQLGESIRKLYEGYIGRYYVIPGARLFAIKSAAGFEKYITPEHNQEIRALAAGIGFEPGEMLFTQCFLDMTVATGCSTLTLPGTACADGVPRLARNLDFPAFDIADRYSTLIIYHPKGRYAFASLGWPGMLGVLSGMNEHGLTLSNMEVRRSRRPPAGMPYTLLYRLLLEQCRTVEEAVALLEKTPRQSANNLMLMDAQGGRAVVEITPEKLTVRRAPDSAALISTNHQRGTDLDEPGRCRRYDSLHDAARRQFGTLSLPALEQMLAGTGQGNLSMQSMIFEPTRRVVYVAVGLNSPQREFKRIDLKPHFR